MSVRIMSLVWAMELPDSEKIVLLALADCANDEGHCWPSVASLVKKCCKSDRTIQAAIRTLCAKGHLTRREVVGKGCNYTVHPIVRFADPRTGIAPEATAPPKPAPPTPEETAPTPETASDKPSKNHQEPSEDCPAGAGLAVEHVFEGCQDLARDLGLNGCPRDLTPERRQLIRARIAQYPLTDFLTVFAKCRDSPFLRGDKGRTPLTIDWLMQKKNFQKVLEGNYDS